MSPIPHWVLYSPDACEQEYLASRAKLIDPTKTNPNVVHVRHNFMWIRFLADIRAAGKPGALLGHSVLLGLRPVGQRMQLHSEQLRRSVSRSP